MEIKEYYMDLPYDLSGSRSKNRFRAELLWGLDKVLDILQSEKEFAVVFDYKCDFEIHYDNELEFYQIKTRKNGKNFTFKELTKKETENSQGSILGKLYVLNKDGDENIKLALVSNGPWNDINNIVVGENKFENMSDKRKEEIKQVLQDEIGVESVNLSGMYYIYTMVNLANPKNEVFGKLTSNFQTLMNSEPDKPNALYNLIYSEIEDKACYEFSISSYEELCEKKGITREDFLKMMKYHAHDSKTGIKEAEQYIDAMKNLKNRKLYKKALSKLVSDIPKSLTLKEIEKEIVKYLDELEELGGLDETIEVLIDNFHTSFPIEYNNAEKIVFYVIVVNKYVEGAYDEEFDD